MKIIERFRNEEILIECFNRNEKAELVLIFKKYSLDEYTIRYTDNLSFDTICIFYGNTNNDYKDYNKTYLTFQEFKQLLKEEENLFMKNDLKSGDMVVTRDRGNGVFFKDFSGNDGISFFTSGSLEIDMYYDIDLKFINGDGINRGESIMKEHDIIKVYRPVLLSSCMSEDLDNYTLIYERQEKSKELLKFEKEYETMVKNYKKDLKSVIKPYDDAIKKLEEEINELRKQ